MTTPNRYATPRGFTNFDEFTDAYGATVTVRESSIVGQPHVWVFTAGGAVAENTGAAHLNRDQATRLRDGLDDWLRETRDEHDA